VVSFIPLPLYRGVRALGTLRIGGWVVLRAGLDAVAKRKYPIMAPAGNCRSVSYSNFVIKLLTK